MSAIFICSKRSEVFFN